MRFVERLVPFEEGEPGGVCSRNAIAKENARRDLRRALVRRMYLSKGRRFDRFAALSLTTAFIGVFARFDTILGFIQATGFVFARLRYGGCPGHLLNAGRLADFATDYAGCIRCLGDGAAECERGNKGCGKCREFHLSPFEVGQGTGHVLQCTGMRITWLSYAGCH